MAEWEEVNRTTHRLPVPGGWLYKTWSESLVGDYYGLKTVAPGTVAVTFVPAAAQPEDVTEVHEETTLTYRRQPEGKP